MHCTLCLLRDMWIPLLAVPLLIAAKNRELLQLYRRGQPFHEQREVKEVK